MGRSGRRLDRLLVLANELDVNQHEDLLRTTLPDTANFEATPEDQTKIQNSLTRLRSVQNQRKSSFIRDKPSNSLTFTAEEATAALGRLVEDGCSAAIAEHLIQGGADVNFSQRKSNSFTKKIRKKDQEDTRSKAFETAVQRSDSSVVRILARNADLANCDGSLGVAIQRGNIDIVQVLLSKGANPNLHADLFRTAVLTGNTAMVCALSSGTCRPSADLATANLFDAVKSNQLNMIQALLACEARADIQNPSALLWAAKSREACSIAALCLAKSPPSSDHLGIAIPIVCEDLSVISAAVIRMVEVLLAAGADGEGVADSIVAATRQGHHELVRLLVDYSEFDHNRSPDAIKSAMLAGDLISFRNLASMPWDTSTRDDLLLFLPTTRPAVPLDLRCAMVRVIVEQVPSKAATSLALLDASENSEVDLVKLLVGSGASVDFQAGKACTVAVLRESPELISALLKGRPSVNTMLRAVRASESLPPTIRSIMLELLLDAGAIGPEVDRALQLALEDPSDPRQNYDLIKLLVSGGADVSVGKGACLILAVTRSDIKALKLLVTGAVRPTPKALEAAFLSATHVSATQLRLDIIQELLRSGARGSYIAQALIKFTNDAQSDPMRITKLLLDEGDGDINYNQGQTILQAVTHQNVDLLRLLVKYAPSRATLSNGLDATMRIKDENVRLEMSDILLQKGPQGKALDDALETATRSSDIALARKLLAAGASIDYMAGLAIRNAIARQDDNMLSLLVKSHCQPTTLSAILLEVVMSNYDADRKLFLSSILLNGFSRLNADSLGALLHETFNDTDDVRVLELFLKAGASVNLPGLEAIRKAIAMDQRRALELMMAAHPTQVTVGQAFEFSWNAAPDSRLELLKILMKERNQGTALNLSKYLVCAVNERPPSQPLISCLLQAGASVGYNNSKCMCDAVSRLDNQTLQLLLQHGRTEDIAAVFTAAIHLEQTWLAPPGVAALSMLLESGAFGEMVDLGLLLAVEKYSTHANASAIVDLLVTNTGSPASSDYHQGRSFELAARTGDTKLIKRLFESQPSEFTINHAFPYIFTSKADETTTLKIIEVFVEYSQERLANELDMNAQHRDSTLKPVLLMAICHSHVSVVKMLLLHGADPSTADRSGWSPLRHASARGDLDIMRLLIKSAPTDDGSLQEAVGNLQHAAVRLLLEAGHDPNYASASHDMRACLEHLVRQQPVSNDGSALKSMFKVLLNAGANGRFHFDGKSLLIIALDMAHATMVVPALLSAFMGAVVNEDFNLHRSDGLVYSPASYIIHQKQLSDPAFGRALLKVLRSYGCEDVYYSESGPQPRDYTSRTAPRGVVDREEIRRFREEQIQAEDEERQRKIAIEDQERHRRLRVEQEDENKRRRLAFEAHEAHLTYERERAQASDANMRSTTTLRLQLQSKEYAQTQQFALTQQQAEMAHKREQNRLQIENVTKENSLRLRSAEAENRLQLNVVDAKVAAERKMHEMAREGREQQDAIEARGHARRLKLIKEEEKRFSRAASVMKLQNGSQSQQRYLTMNDEPD
jgi:ankyrin repeat protein